MLPIRTILHPTDFSASAENAFHFAQALARDYGAQLKVVHVSPAPIMNFGQGIIPPEPLQMERELRTKLHGYVEEAQTNRVEESLLVGDPAREIVKFASENSCDLIVMGTHGWRGLSRVFMGSVANQVLSRARCPVLVIRMPFPEGEAVEEPEIVEPVAVEAAPA